MKNLILCFCCMLCHNVAQAQNIELNDLGAYERQEVVVVDSVDAAMLYDRAMLAVSDWGFDHDLDQNGHGLGYHDRSAGQMVFKGAHEQGTKTGLTLAVTRFIDFEVKVRTKDGRAQVTVKIPTMTAIASNGMKREYTLRQILKESQNAGKKKQERVEDFMKDVVETAEAVLELMKRRLKDGSGLDDDF